MANNKLQEAISAYKAFLDIAREYGIEKLDAVLRSHIIKYEQCLDSKSKFDYTSIIVKTLTLLENGCFDQLFELLLTTHNFYNHHCNFEVNNSNSHELYPHLQIVACAGSGKTTTMVARILNLLRQPGVEPGNIVAVTYSIIPHLVHKIRYNQY